MWTLLASVAAAIVNALVGRFFPSHPQVTPEVIAQAQKDRADALQSQSDARKSADVGRATVGDAVARSPGELLKPDANELPPD